MSTWAVASRRRCVEGRGLRCGGSSGGPGLLPLLDLDDRLQLACRFGVRGIQERIGVLLQLCAERVAWLSAQVLHISDKFDGHSIDSDKQGQRQLRVYLLAHLLTRTEWGRGGDQN